MATIGREPLPAVVRSGQEVGKRRGKTGEQGLEEEAQKSR